jgi:membrane-associated phospholipid phosphatase
MALQETLSDFGNAVVASAAALVILAWLWGRLGWVAGLVFLICFASVIGSVVGLKLIAYDLRPPVGETPILGLSQGAPSGHTALATIVYGSLAAVLATVDRRPRAWAAAVLCVTVIVAVAVTRVTLARHTIGDVIAGLLLAGVGVGVFARALLVQTRDRPVNAMAVFAATSAAAVLVLASGFRFNALALL